MTDNGPSSKVWLAGGGALAVIIVLISWFIVISPVRADTQSLRENTEAVDASNAVLQTKLDALKEQDANRDELIQSLMSSLSALPATVALPDFNRQVVSQAALRKVDLTSVTIGPPTTPAAQAGTVVADPTAPASGLLAVPITITTKGAQLDQLYFLRDLQQVGPRRALVTSTAFTTENADETPDETGAVVATSDVYTLTTQLTIFASSLSATDREALADVLGDDLAG